jgi:hypothetical protein
VSRFLGDSQGYERCAEAASVSLWASFPEAILVACSLSLHQLSREAGGDFVAKRRSHDLPECH